MSNEFLDYVEDILDAMDKAEALLVGVAYEVFEADFRINFAVVRALEIVGEAARRIPEEIRQRYAEVPRRGMAGMRDRIIHGYDIVDLQVVWDVVRQDIPRVRPHLDRILQDHAGL
jgi:uncharacterized protein with HEPN domain